jgi:hypothetical protein
MFTSFGYFETDLDNVRVMHEIARVLMDGGVFLMDFLNAGAVRVDATAVTRTERGAVIDERRELVDGGRFLVKRVAVRMPSRAAVEYDERVRLYSHDDLVAMAEAAVFSIRARYGDYQLAPYDAASSHRVILVCEKGDSA